MITGMHIPANIWKPVCYVQVSNNDCPAAVSFPMVRDLIDCRLIEVIRPSDDAIINDVGEHVALCDEEARIFGGELNVRASMLFDYPFGLVGDVVVVADWMTSDGPTLRSVNSGLLEFLQTETEMEVQS